MRQGDNVAVGLQANTCQQNYAVDQVALTRTYKKRTLFGGPILMIGGVAIGAGGAALIVAAKDQPASCPDNDDDCTSRDEMRGLGVVASGLGAAGLIVGAYNTFKGPVLLHSDNVVVASQTQTNDCTPPVAEIPVSISADGVVIASGQTDDRGFVAWRVPDRDLALWPRIVTLSIADGAPLPIDCSSEVAQARARVLEQLQRELDAAAERNPEIPPPDVSPRADVPVPGDASTSPGQRGLIYRVRAVAHKVLIDHPVACETAVAWTGKKLLEGVFSEEKAAIFVLEKVFGEGVSEGWAKAMVQALHWVFPEFFDQLEATIVQAKHEAASAVCTGLAALINPDPE